MRAPGSVTRPGWPVSCLSMPVAAPFVVECPAHLECHLYQTIAFPKGEVFIFGTISSIAVEEARLTDELSERYHALNPFFFLEGGWYATLGEPRQATHPEQDQEPGALSPLANNLQGARLGQARVADGDHHGDREEPIENRRVMNVGPSPKPSRTPMSQP